MNLINSLQSILTLTSSHDLSSHLDSQYEVTRTILSIQEHLINRYWQDFDNASVIGDVDLSMPGVIMQVNAAYESI
jgi:hypothetical protein